MHQQTTLSDFIILYAHMVGIPTTYATELEPIDEDIPEVPCTYTVELEAMEETVEE